jgi:hypothetical protein
VIVVKERFRSLISISNGSNSNFVIGADPYERLKSLGKKDVSADSVTADAIAKPEAKPESGRLYLVR